MKGLKLIDMYNYLRMIETDDSLLYLYIIAEHKIYWWQAGTVVIICVKSNYCQRQILNFSVAMQKSIMQVQEWS